MTAPLLKFETHCHSIYSGDSLNRVEDLIRIARKRNISKLAITDHNSIKGALLAQKLAPDLIIVGEEILTTKGELLAFFVKEEVPAGLTPAQAIQRLRDQDAFISVSHPFDRQRHGWKLRDLQEITPLVDAIEVFNARCLLKSINDQAMDYAQEHGLPGTAGSDAHTLIEVGRAVLILPDFKDSATLSRVICDAYKRSLYSSPLVRFGSSYARWVKQNQHRRANG